jgi:hypothetical protein
MSLRAFHLFFISISILLAFGFGIWGVRSFSTGGDTTNMFMGVGSFILGAGLIIYGIKVRRKLKQVTQE